MKLSIIIGSVRDTPTGKMIANNIQDLLQKRSDVEVQVLFVSDYHLPFYTDSVSPASRTEPIQDPLFKKWSDVISESSAFIIVAPEYNGGYPAPLKNALDSLYTEWNHKLVGIIGYSGGPTGGASMITQLQQVLKRLEMVPVSTTIKIPHSWKAFDQDGNLLELDKIAKELSKMVDEMLKVYKN